MGPLLNELRAQYSREEFPRTANSESPNVDAGVIGNFGTRSFLPATTSDYRAQLADGLTLLRGNHTFKFGFDYSYIGVSQRFGSNQFGTFVVSGSDVRSTLQILSRSGGPEGNRFDHPTCSTVARSATSLLKLMRTSWLSSCRTTGACSGTSPSITEFDGRDSSIQSLRQTMISC